MANIYELTGELLALMDMAENDELDPQALADTMEGLAGEFDDKSSQASLQPGDGFFNHATGHNPTPDSMEEAWRFLEKHL